MNRKPTTTKWMLTMGLSCFMGTQAFAAITYMGLNPTTGSVVDTDGNGLNLGTTYTGTWSESNTGASGAWSVIITWTGAGDLTWQSNSGDSASVGIGNPNGGGLVLDFQGTSPNQVDALKMEFSMTGNPGSTTADVIYAVGPVAGNGSFPDWGNAVINTGGTYVADTGGGQNANYNSETGEIDPTPAGQGNGNHNWYVSYASGTTLNWFGDSLQRDTHIFGASEVSAIPEPSSSLLISLAGISVILRRKRK